MRAVSLEGVCTFDGCEATVAELEACMRVIVAALATDARRDTCADEGGNWMRRDQAQKQAYEGVACTIVRDKCPGFLEI